MSQIVPDIISGQDMVSLAPSVTVREAANLMAERKVAAILVMEEDRLAGIFTERDAVARVVAQGLNPETTPLSEVMTKSPSTLGPEADPIAALRMMKENGYRHIPIMDQARVVGMVSARDLNAFTLARLEDDLRRTESYIFGDATA